MRRWKRTAGYTAVETAVAAGIMLFIAGGAVSVMKTGTKSWKDVRQQTRNNTHVQEALHKVIETMKTSTNALVDNTNPDHSVVTFQVPTNRKDDGTIEYGAFERKIDKGKLIEEPKKGYWAQLLVKGVPLPDGKTMRVLALRTLYHDRVKVKGIDIPLVKFVDKAFGGRKGFQIAESGGIYSALLRINEPGGKRLEAKSSAGIEDIDLTSIDTTANDMSGVDTSGLATAIAGLEALLAASQGATFEDKLQNAVNDSLEAQSEAADDLEKAVDKMKSAVNEIENAINDGLPRSTGDPMADGMTQLARQFAQDAKAAALAQGANPQDVSDATNKIAEGDALRAAGDFEGAVSKYKDAVGKVL